MTSDRVHLTGVERHFEDNELIVSKTDLKGRITYANDVFIRIADYTEQELVDAPHSILRHPGMPRCVFKLLWDVVQDGREIFAYVVNRSKNGDHYWVFAHVTPTFGSDGKIIGYHSNRRVPKRDALAKIEPIYQQLLAVENATPDRKNGLAKSTEVLHALLKDVGQTYEQFVFSV